MRESIYLFKEGFRPIWEDRRNVNGGSWTFRVVKDQGRDIWTRVQLLAIGERLQSVLDQGESKTLDSVAPSDPWVLLFRRIIPSLLGY